MKKDKIVAILVIAFSAYVGTSLELLAARPAQAATAHVTPVELIFDDEPVDLFDKPGAGRQKIESIPAAQFPREVWFLGVTQEAGIMWNIKLSESGPARWVKATQVGLPEEEGEAKVVCDATEQAVSGNYGRGISGNSSCAAK